MSRLLTLLIVLIITAPIARGQDYYDRDSLWQVYKSSRPDSNQVKLLIQLGQQYENNNPDSAITLYETALKLSERIGYTRGIISYYTNVTYVYNLKGRYDTSLVLNLKSVEIARKFGNEERLAACLGNTGSSYMQLQDHKNAVKYFLEAAAIMDKLNNQTQLSILYGNLSVEYQQVGQITKSIEYGERGVKIAREINNVYVLTAALANLGMVYNAFYMPDKAIGFLDEARQLASKTNNQYAELNVLLNLSDAHIKKSDFSKVGDYCRAAMKIATALGDEESRAIAYRGLAIHHFNLNEPEAAEKFALQSLEICKVNNFMKHTGKIYMVLSEIATLRKDFRTNNEYKIKSDSIERLLVNESVLKSLEVQEAHYATEKKQQQITSLEKEKAIRELSLNKSRLIIAILIGSVISVIAIAMLARRSLKQKEKLLEKENQLKEQQIETLQQEKQLMAAEAVLKGQEEERARLAKDLHDGLGGLLSGVKFSLTNMKTGMVLDQENVLLFQRSLDMLDHSIAELRRVAHNMMPEVLINYGLPEAIKSFCESLRQAGTMQINWQVLGMEERIPSNVEITLYRILQELATNALKHSGATMLLVQLARNGNEISLTVEDNGKGFDVKQDKGPSSSGLTSIASRVEYLKGKLDIQSGAGNGTSVYVTVNI
jgi:two-component system, NarL family, sensor kinase